MGLFNKNAVPQTPAMKYKAARSNLLAVVAFSVINLLLMVLKADVYFLFSATVPLFVAAVGAALTAELSTPVPYIASAILALAIIGIYLVCYFQSKKKRGWLVAALVLFSLDCVFLLLTFSADSIIDILFHAWMMYYLIVGVKNARQALEEPEMPAEPGAPEPLYGASEVQQPVLVNGEPVAPETNPEE